MASLKAKTEMVREIEDGVVSVAFRFAFFFIRLWAEVFHVSGQGGAVKWQQVSEDLVPVNITCVQDSPDCVFHITAYNSQVDKILDVRLVQPGTRLGQASECFVYWKDSHTGDTWGLNFTSPLDAKQFRECCSPAFKFSRKASSSYSLKLEPPKQKSKNSKRKPQSTPSSPSRGRAELQCTCMTAENLHRARNGRVRYTGGAATLPRAQQLSTRQGLEHTRSGTTSSQASARATARAQAVAAALTASSKQQQQQQQQDGASSSTTAASVHGAATTSRATTSGSSVSSHRRRAAAAAACEYSLRNESGSRSGGGGESNRLRDQYASRKEQAKSVDYSPSSPQLQASSRSKSSDNVFEEASGGGGARGDLAALSLDSNTLKRMLDPLPPSSSSSPDQQQPPPAQQQHLHQQQQHRRSVPSVTHGSTTPRLRDREHRSESGRRRSLERSVGLDLADGSPPSDHFLYDNLCYATTPPSSSNDSSSEEGDAAAGVSGGGGGAVASGLATPRRQASHEESPTSKLLMEYETHLRNALARGMDAESYSLHTFEALLTQSMENVAHCGSA
ncbi:hypothetical protein HPB52_010059 [Rhipicephalus sanguineus]|uniref:WH1 domain-containing protein n=1 Tax=Rhipicephalus sanguineus TaxID=34632 RepID=A0A9D4PLL2_RHISA|nr:hypothetical protein HPB52_010059 [Rhipicephalus sanguineus]